MEMKDFDRICESKEAEVQTCSFCKFISTVSKMSIWKSPKNCAKFDAFTFRLPKI